VPGGGGGITRPPYSSGIQIRGPDPPGLGNLESETVKYGQVRWESNPRMTALARIGINCKRQAIDMVVPSGMTVMEASIEIYVLV
jgi:hypothetical protein